jgi:type VI secretion system protein ImpM
MVQFGLPQQADNVPAWFGKLPGIGDFAQRRLAPDFLKLWDSWLQHNLQRLRDQRDDWMAHYLEAPLWYFALGCDIVNANPWVGILMPSVDAVGRYFPLTLAIELQACESEVVASEEMDKICDWWRQSAAVALTALDTNQDALNFDAILSAAFSSKSQLNVQSQTTKIDQIPLPGNSIWLANVGEDQDIAHVVDGLPKDNVFDILFGYSDITT